MSSHEQIRTQSASILIGASVMLSLSMGMRQSFGLFLAPAVNDLGITAAEFTLAIAVQNLVWGVTQPFVGALADEKGYRRVMVFGVLVYVLGLAGTALAGGPMALVLSTGVLVGLALSCTSAGIALPVAARAVPASVRSVRLGLVSAIGSIGSFVAAPLGQGLIAGYGWQLALAGYVGLAAAMLPAALMAGRIDRFPVEDQAAKGESLSRAIRLAAGHGGYMVTAASFFVCGLQLVFLTTHLPSYLTLCDMDPMLGAQSLAILGGFNVIGSYLFGWLGDRYPKHVLLGLIYILRSILIGAYFFFPPTVESTLLFSAAMGLLWLGVIPLINGLIANIFGVRHMATLGGVAFFSHQLGSFLGAWGGGVMFDWLGSYDRAWQFGIAIGLLAGIAQIMANVRPSENRDEWSYQCS